MPDTAAQFDHFDVSKVKEQFLDKELDELNSFDVFKGTVEPSDPIQINDHVSVTFKADAASKVQVFNGVNDKDDDGVLGVVGDDTDQDDLTLSPQVELNNRNAWIKYHLEAGVEASATAKVSDLGLTAAVDKGVSLNSYRIHDLNELFRNAMTRDIRTFKSILSSGHVSSLKAGEAVSLITDGTFKMDLSLSWSDIYSSTLGSLSKALKTSGPLIVDFNTAISLDASLSFSDSFKLIFSGSDDDRIRLAVRKVNTRDTTAALTAGITAQFKDPKIFETAVNNLVKNLFDDLGIDDVEAFLNEISVETLTEKQKELVAELFERLDLKGVLSKVARLREKWEGLQSRLRQVATRITTEIDDEQGDLTARINNALETVKGAISRFLKPDELQDLIDNLEELQDLDEEEQKNLERLLETLSLDGPFESVEAFLERYNKFRDRIETWLTRLGQEITGEIGDLADRAREGVDDIVEALLGNEFVTDLNKILADADEAALSESVRQALDEFLKKQGLHKAIDKIEKLKQRWAGFKKKLETTIREVAESKITLSFGLEYHGIKSETSVLEALFTRAAIKDPNRRYHKALLSGNLEPVLEVLRTEADPRIELIRFLEEDRIERDISWGFKLGLGRWSFWGKSRLHEVHTIRKRLNGDQRINLMATRSYGWKWFGDDSGMWSVAFTGQTHDYLTNPDAAALDYAMNLLMVQKHEQLNQAEVEGFLDQAVLWGAIDESHLEAARSQLERYEGKRVNLEVSIDIENEAFRFLLLIFSSMRPSEFGASLAAAMAWSNQNRNLQSVERRRFIYGGLWNKYLLDPHLNWPREIDHALRRNRFRGLKGMEKRSHRHRSENGYTMNGLLQMNDGLFVRYEAFCSAMNQLSQAIENGQEFMMFRDAFLKADQFFSVSHWVRALGHFSLGFLNRRYPFSTRAVLKEIDENGKESRAVHIS